MIFFLITTLLAGVVLIGLGVRGRVVGSDPHCLQCGFNLRGLEPTSLRCPECGVETSLPDAVEAGARERRGGMILGGVLITAAAGVPLVIVGWLAFSEFDWTAIEPKSWLADDIDTGGPNAHTLAVNEFTRRICSDRNSQADVDAIIDLALSRQADPNKHFDSAWVELMDVAERTGRLGDERLARYLRQGTSATMIVKPSLRRGQEATVRFDVQFKASPRGNNLLGTYSCDPLHLGNAIILPRFETPRDATFWVAMANSFETHFRLKEQDIAGLVDGQQLLTSTLHFRMTTKHSSDAMPLCYDVPVSARIELLPAGGSADEFKTEQADRAAMNQSIAGHVVVDDAGRLGVQITTSHLAHPMAVRAIVAQGASEQSAGTLLLAAHQPLGTWQTWIAGGTAVQGPVKVSLIPDRTAADAQTALSTYWGEPIILNCFANRVDSTPPYLKNPAMEGWCLREIAEPIVRRSATVKGRLEISIFVAHCAAKVSWDVHLSADGVDQRLPPWTVAELVSSHYVATADDKTLSDVVDVVLGPDADWRLHCQDLQPPWGGELRFPNIKVLPALPAAPATTAP